MTKYTQPKIEQTPIIDNLTTADTDKVTSANQGKVLKAMVDGKLVPPPNDGKVYCYYQNEWIELRGVEIKDE